MFGSFAGCFLDRLGEEVRFATAAVARLSSLTTEMFFEDVTTLEFFDECMDLFDGAPTDFAAGEWGSLSVLVQAIETANSCVQREFKAIFPVPNWLERECYTILVLQCGESGWGVFFVRHHFVMVLGYSATLLPTRTSHPPTVFA